MVGVPQPTSGFFMVNPWSVAALRVDPKRFYACKRGHFFGREGGWGGFRPEALKIDMSVNEEIEC